MMRDKVRRRKGRVWAELSDPLVEPEWEEIKHVRFGLPRDPFLAGKELEILVNNGSAAACCVWGRAYEIGKAGPVDLIKARFWYKKAVDLGYIWAAYCIAGIYIGEKQYAEAFVWHCYGAERGLSFSMRWLALMYIRGAGVQKNYTLAMAWCKKAADLGYLPARKSLGYWSLRGLFGVKNVLPGILMFLSALFDLFNIVVNGPPHYLGRGKL
jgi:TPR repeat protein